jgi:hypothetical protein
LLDGFSDQYILPRKKNYEFKTFYLFLKITNVKPMIGLKATPLKNPAADSLP